MVSTLEEDIPSIDDIINKYPPRALPSGAVVSRFGPSPTGFMHIGGLYVSLIVQLITKQTKGVFFLRIEDTDSKREVEGATELIHKSLAHFGIKLTEGLPHQEGSYGPYIQSERKKIYQCFAYHLVSQGLAYPCFMDDEQVKEIRRIQKIRKAPIGIYGDYSIWRNADSRLVGASVAKNEPYTIRYRAKASNTKRTLWNDLLKGPMNLPNHSIDIPLIKSDGMPTYHFAHVIDDYLMGTTHVFRGDEWLNSTPLHLELFNSLRLTPPVYAHIAPINKLDVDGNKRKLSKRKDPEASVSYFIDKGYPTIPVMEYLLSLANSSFEVWRKNNLDKDITDYQISIKGLAKSSGPLFDEQKLQYFSSEYISRMQASEIYHSVSDFYDSDIGKFAQDLRKQPEKWIEIFNIERMGPKPRKDLKVWSEFEDKFHYFLADMQDVDPIELASPLCIEMISKIIAVELKKLERNHKAYFSDKDTWFKSIKTTNQQIGLAGSSKEFNNNKDIYPGSIVHYTQALRFALTGEVKTPDLYSIMKTLGNKICRKRLTAFLKSISEFTTD